MIGKVLPSLAQNLTVAFTGWRTIPINGLLVQLTTGQVTLPTTWLVNSIKVAMLCLCTKQAKAARMPITKSHPTIKSLPALVKPTYTAGKAQHEVWHPLCKMDKENIAFREYPWLHTCTCSLQECHGVNLGQYILKNETLGKKFHAPYMYIEESQGQFTCTCICLFSSTQLHSTSAKETFSSEQYCIAT